MTILRRLAQQRLNVVRDVAHERNLDEDERLVDERGMEESEAATVAWIEATAQVVPTLDFVHGLVFDDLLQDGCRRLPVNAPQHQKAAIEPRCQKMHEIAIDKSQRRIGDGEEVLAHGDDLSRCARRQVEAAEEFLARALDGTLQRRDGARVRVRQVGFGRSGERLFVRLHGGEIAKKRAAFHRFQGTIVRQDLAGDGNARGLATAREQGGRKLTQAGPRARTAKRAWQELATLLGDGAQQLLKKGDVYRN